MFIWARCTAVSPVDMEVSEDDEEEACNACDRVIYSLDSPAYYNPATNALMRVPYHTHRLTGIAGANIICLGILITALWMFMEFRRSSISHYTWCLLRER